MPSKKKKYNARFPAGRIKKIMQTDEEVGKVAQAVPIIISRTLELFVESLLTKAMEITSAKNAKTLSPSHMKQCILSESRFDFLKDLVKSLPDVTSCDSEDGASHTNTTAQTCTNLVAKSETSSVVSRRQQVFFSSKEQMDHVPQPPQTITAMSTRMAPNFYRERNEANVSSSDGYEHNSPTPSLSVSQTSAHAGAIELETVDVSDEENGGDDDKEESGSLVIHDQISPPQYTPPEANVAVDEDYDT